MGGAVSNLKNVWPAILQLYPPKSRFSVDQIPDLSGRVILVTGRRICCPLRGLLHGLICHIGGNSGLGYETIKVRCDPAPFIPTLITRFTRQVLLQHNAKVYLTARNKEKADAAIASLKEATGKEALFHELDLGSLAKTKASAEAFLKKEPELHVLFNNASVRPATTATSRADCSVYV